MEVREEGLNEEKKYVTNQENMILQSPLKKLPRTEGGPGHEHGNSGGPGGDTNYKWEQILAMNETLVWYRKVKR
ncbi:hypothetical protein PHAVU_006G161300 [Phaseolus vulgaris]|uniref:Uncharacterized protein n=1 Tax=Phaseolus vulgaris TaxID=3885 RepID=V7BPG3_PHAVU|nr:hypothetical protein PHAVU_006G161300g [Phaseolus vulgaris]ESW19859.1 hypothetical protein PHAVU_006G161300g [Phaseolus vulgaris]